MTDPRRLKPSEFCRLLNSTPLGEVIGERWLHRLRTSAGLRIGDTRTVDLLRYTNYMAMAKHSKKSTPKGEEGNTGTDYEKIKDAARARNAAISLAGRDIGDLPPVVNPERKARAELDFKFFCETYFSRVFVLAWSPDHLKVIAKIEQAVLRGGLFAMAMPRGSGKSTISEIACIWAVLFGHREFVCLIGSSEGHAMDMLDAIKTEFEGNELLLEDFPEATYPIRALGGISNRCNGQLFKGERTHIGWTASEVVLPTVVGSRASGAIIKVAGITGRIRGMKYKRADGRSVRPSLVVLDDPQTDESARSLSQCATREATVAGAVLGLAGPGTKISGIMPCTVIRPGDMADSILSRDKHPEWNGERTKMVYAFPANDLLWQKYAEIRAESLRAGNEGVEATEYYRANRAAMDEGAIIAWPERYNHDELSAIQHAMNLKLQDERAFFAEYQNEPLVDLNKESDALASDLIFSKCSNLEQWLVPKECSRITLGVDVGLHVLWYTLIAWDESFGGSVIGYGCWPSQSREWFSSADARPTLQEKYPMHPGNAAVYKGLTDLLDHVLNREYAQQETGARLRVERGCVDAGWETELIYQFVRESPHAAILSATLGRTVTTGLPIAEWPKKEGERVGWNWRFLRPRLVFDPNAWKSFLADRWRTASGLRGRLSLFGHAAQHQLFAAHVCSESSTPVEVRGRRFRVWARRPNEDNHWLDSTVLAAVAASFQGLQWHASGQTTSGTKPRPKIKLSDLYSKKHGGAS